MPAVRAQSLTKTFNGESGVFDVDLEVATGSIVGLIGPSGSGKTTTVRLITGLLTPTSGSVTVLGEDPQSFTRETRGKLGYMPQDSVLYPGLTLRQNLDFAGSLFGLRHRRKRIDEMIEFVELEGAADRVPRQASGGEKRRLALAATLIHSPVLIFLDEPTAGLDPVLRRKLWDRFEEISDAGRTMVVTTQYVGEAAYCDYVAVLANGRVVTFDTPDGLKRSAYGGEMVDVVFAIRPGGEALQYLRNVAGGRDIRWLDERSVRVVVEDAGTSIPQIAAWATEHSIEVEKVEAYSPPFDDIFVELVESHAEQEELEPV